jgi:predicted cation transporter
MTEAISETLYCANHPQTPTALRCNRCGKPICSRCIVRTPVGYRCRDCVRGQQQTFESAVWYDYAIAAAIALPLSAIAGALVTALGFYSIFLAPVVGGIIAEIVRWAVRRRRGRYLPHTAAAAFALGGLGLALLPLGLAFLAALFGAGQSGATINVLGLLFRSIWPLLYAALGAGTVFTRLRGIAIT